MCHCPVPKSIFFRGSTEIGFFSPAFMAFYIDYILEMLFSTLVRKVCFKRLKNNVICDYFIDVFEINYFLRQILQIN